VLWTLGKKLLEAEDAELNDLQSEWNKTFETLKTTTGHS